jgi:hypothetical protein
LNRSISARFAPTSFQLRPAVALVVASILVAIAILIDGSAAKTFNGLGGILWIGSAVWLIRELRREAWNWPIFCVVAFECLVLVLLVKPSNLAFAVIGFALGGISIAWMAISRSYEWAALLPAMWLPMHLLVAICRAVYRAITDGEAAVRSDPPLTAALVPFAMVISVLAGAWLVDLWRNRHRKAKALANA